MKTIQTLSLLVFCLLAVPAFAQSKTKSKPVTDSTAIIQEFVGTYAISGSSDFSSVIITSENGKLFGRADIQSVATIMIPTQIADKFTVTSSDGYAEVTFLRDDKKKVTGVKVYYGNGSEVTGLKQK
jgi:hypothetical protein